MVGATEEAREAVRTGLGLASKGTRRGVGGGSSTRENIPLNCDSRLGAGVGGVQSLRGPQVYLWCGSGEQTCLAICQDF